MSKVNGAKKLTDNRFLNLYELNAETKDNKPIKYLVASRAKEVEDLKAINHKEKSDAVAILGITSDKKSGTCPPVSISRWRLHLRITSWLS